MDPMNAPALSPRAGRTRQALLAAGLELLVDRPIDAIPIDDIVAAAGVAKGSFFNHFADKPGFGTAVAAYVRSLLEARVTATNDGVTDPVERLANGMLVAARFALAERKPTVVMLRGMSGATAHDNALNDGVRADMALCVAAGVARPEAAASGVLYWLGLCQVLMSHFCERRPEAEAAVERLCDMLVMGLTGIGVEPGRAMAAARAVSARLLS
jgi:AcrR family transcriptional regulator